MKNAFSLASVAAFVSSAVSQEFSSAPFALFLRSSNTTLNGTVLGACHQGAAIEGLCTTGAKVATAYETFYLGSYSEPAAGTDPSGILFWNLTVGTGENTTMEYPSAMELSLNPTSNVANPTFLPTNSSDTYVTFTEGDCSDMYIPRNQDDTVSPPVGLEEVDKVQNWYVCLTRYAYLYETLVWKIGITGEPQNPSCQKVQVYRQFV